MNRLFAALAFAAVATAAHAQLGPPNPDVDRDGKVTFDEFKKVSAGGMFERLDANNDGKITRTELNTVLDRFAALAPEGAKARMTARFDQDDANKDGVLTRAEAEAAAKPRFLAADSNHDGWLSKGELLTLRQGRRGPG